MNIAAGIHFAIFTDNIILIRPFPQIYQNLNTMALKSQSTFYTDKLQFFLFSLHCKNDLYCKNDLS